MRCRNASTSARPRADGSSPWSFRPARRVSDSLMIAPAISCSRAPACLPRRFGRSWEAQALADSRSHPWLMRVKSSQP